MVSSNARQRKAAVNWLHLWDYCYVPQSQAFIPLSGNTFGARVVIQCWLLKVPKAHIYRLDLTPDIDQGLLTVMVLGSQSATDAQVQVRHCLVI